MKELNIKHIPLPAFIILGFALWGAMFLISPANPTQPFSLNTIIFISLSFVLYFAGYLVIKTKQKTRISSTLTRKHIWYLILVIISSWLIRYIDLFIHRGISFNNTIEQNRELFKVESLSVVYIIASVVKELYFAPLLFSLLLFKKNKPLILASSLLYLLPLLVPFLRGTRKDIVLVFLFLLISLLISKSIRLKIKTVLLLFVFAVLLNVVLYSILIKREAPKFKTKETEKEILAIARYNYLYKPNKKITKQINNSSGIKRAILYNHLHLSQYYCHGVFELDYLIKDKLKTNSFTKGKYNFKLFYKFLDQIGLKYEHNKVYEYLPRKDVYITFMGGLFLDFGWFGLIFMFLLGSFHKMIDNKIKQKEYLFLILYIFFIVFNIFFPVINLFNGTGLYLVIAAIGLITINKVALKFKKENN